MNIFSKSFHRSFLYIKRTYAKDTHFGFQRVSSAEKQAKVDDIFTNVASKYDLMNDLMSFGVHRLWKDHFVDRMAPLKQSNCIDVAGGTGDIAFRMVNSHLKYSSERSDDDESFNVTVCDINESMIDVGKQRAAKGGLEKYLKWTEGNAEKLPMDDNSFDIYTIAYGIRNCTDVQQVLNEAHRVLKPYGRFMCLEFSEVDNILIKMLYDSYSFQVIPVMGQLVAGDWRSYQYLVESIRQFPNQRDFSAMIEKAGFKAVTHENLAGGISCIHSGFKL